ncbi:acyl carrier protein [Streptomyces sp. NPDC005538]|uniref:acyl carrier protein n=1 Tax=unclassified Streptomyces TaxID=2593676 RepID=UPI00339F1B1C
MSDRQFDIDDLKRILLEGAGTDDAAMLQGDILDVSFDDLGYDSLARLETGLRIDREFGVELDDAVLTDSETPRQLVTAVNEHLAAAGADAA